MVGHLDGLRGRREGEVTREKGEGRKAGSGIVERIGGCCCWRRWGGRDRGEGRDGSGLGANDEWNV